MNGANASRSKFLDDERDLIQIHIGALSVIGRALSLCKGSKDADQILLSD